MKVDLSGQVALATGAATGIGKACAEALVVNGATVPSRQGGARKTSGNRGDVLDVADRNANGVLFLSSSAASHVTGHTLVVVGGWTAGYARDW